MLKKNLLISLVATSVLMSASANAVLCSPKEREVAKVYQFSEIPVSTLSSKSTLSNLSKSSFSPSVSVDEYGGAQFYMESCDESGSVVNVKLQKRENMSTTETNEWTVSTATNLCADYLELNRSVTLTGPQDAKLVIKYAKNRDATYTFEGTTSFGEPLVVFANKAGSAYE